ncbi:MAG TPA: prepilin peptidase [Rickettsiales bacterium]|nr:prepilin peptidase [Rickettsiales bacterium]
MHWLDILPGIIWSGFLGLAIGNFATNPIYRLPRNESLFGRDPYCGDCNALLKPRDLFPVFSWLSTRGRCRYCGANVPGSYTIVEAVTGLLFVLFYLKYGFSERFMLASFGATAFIMIAAMIHIDNFFSNRTLVAAMMFGMLDRTLVDGSLYGFLGTGYAGLLAGAVAWKLSGRPMARDMGAFPGYLKLLVAAGIWVHPVPFAVLLAATLVAGLIGRQVKQERLAEWAIIAGVITAMAL